MPAPLRRLPQTSFRRRSQRTKSTTRRLSLQPLEPRCLLAAVGDWAYIDLALELTGTDSTFEDLTGIAFYGDQLAVVANTHNDAGTVEGHLLLLDYDIDAHTASVADNMLIPSLGGETHVDDVSTDGSTLYMTGYSKSFQAPTYGEAYRATFDGTNLDTMGLGVLTGDGVTDPVMGSQGMAVNSNGVVVGTSDSGRAVFEYDQQLVSAGHVNSVGVALGISDDRVKVGISSGGVVWEADNTTSRFVTDPTGRGTGLFGISPDHSRLLGSASIVNQPAETVSEKLTWWTYDGTPTVVDDGFGNYVDGRFTDGTNADIGYYVGIGPLSNPGDLLHMELTGETTTIENWFETQSGQDIAPLVSSWGPEIAYNSADDVVAIVSGSHALVMKINRAPVAADDSYETPENVPLDVAAPGVLANDTDGGATLQAVLVQPPAYGTLQLQSDGSFTYTPDTTFNRQDSFQYVANDGELDSAATTVLITIVPEYPWYNGALPLDVSDDGHVSPIDALLGIDSINQEGSRQLPTTRDLPLTSPFLDTSRDGRLSPIDVLLVINYLNGQSTVSGEGEAFDGGLIASSVASHDLPGMTLGAGQVNDSGDASAVPEHIAGVQSIPQSALPHFDTGFAAQDTQTDADLWREWNEVPWAGQLESLLSDLVDDLKVD